MPHLHRDRPQTISNARTSRTVSAVVAAVADPDTGQVAAVALEVPTGSVASIVAWIDGDPSRARAAAGHRLKGVRDAVAALLESEG